MSLIEIKQVFECPKQPKGWHIDGLVVKKTEPRTSDSGVKHFNFTIADGTGEIKVVAFKEQCEKYSNLVQEDKWYRITEANIKEADQRYSTDSHELQFNLLTKIVPLDTDAVKAKLAGTRDDSDPQPPVKKIKTESDMETYKSSSTEIHRNDSTEKIVMFMSSVSVEVAADQARELDRLINSGRYLAQKGELRTSSDIQV